MTNQPNKYLRAQLPIPEVPRWGLTTYDAKDPDTNFPSIEPQRQPQGAPNALFVLPTAKRLGARSHASERIESN